MKKAAVIIFPGSNCDRDMEVALRKAFKSVQMIWHKDTSLPNDLDFIALPGGFSYGDYLRSGAMAAKSPIMNEVISFAKKGGFILGICNGFQILTEAGLLPGTLLRNQNLKFLSRKVKLKIENRNSIFTNAFSDDVTSLPIAHHDGNYFCNSDILQELKASQSIAFRYLENPNGSLFDIAGIFNKNKNILGMMPHPERAVDMLAGGVNGLSLFHSLINR